MPTPEVAGSPDLSRSGHERPLVSMEGWARFEQRARQRRIERRLQAARRAIQSRDLVEAHAALKELRELDPAHPELDPLTLQLAYAEQAARPRRGALAVAATAFAIVMLAASWIGNTGLLQSYPMVETAALAPAPETLLATRDLAVEIPIATGGEAETVLAEAIAGPPAVTTVAARPASPSAPTLPPAEPLPAQIDLTPAAPEPSFVPAPAPAPPVPAPARTPVAPPIAAASSSTGSAAIDAVPAAVVIDDTELVKGVLQKYRAAYERLDARLVHAVWPGVNEAALARAFQGLESQALTFKTCDVQLRGPMANVACTGTTRYVPKIGSHEPRVEPLAWNFTLRKRAGDWEIESARAER